MAIPLPRRRNNPMGRPNTGQVPTRSNIQRQNVSQDPGARGGPTSIPTNAFTGSSQGIIDLGTGIQQVADAESAQLQQELNRSDYINTEIEKGNLANDIDKIANNFDAISGSYRNTDGSVDKDGMNKVDQLIEQASQNRLNIVQNNRSMSQRASDEFSMQAELVKQNAYAKLRKNVATARTEQFKLSLQAQLVQVAADEATASDVVNLIKNNRVIANGFISSLSTKDRNEALATASTGLLKNAVRKFVLGAQFRQAKLRVGDIIKELGENNISTTGWTAKSINDAYLYIDEEQQKFNDTQRSSKLTEAQKDILEIKKLKLPEKQEQALIIHRLGGPKPDPIPEKIKIYNLMKEEFDLKENPTAEEYNDFYDQKRKLLYNLDPATDSQKTDLERQIELINQTNPAPRTEEDQIRYLEDIRALATGIKPKDAPQDSDTDKKQARIDKMLADEKISSDVWVDATLNLNSGLKKPVPSATTLAQDRAIAYLNQRLKDKKITQDEYDRRMMQVHNFVGQEKFPELDEDLKPGEYNLISDVVDSRLGAKAIAAGTRQPKPGYEEFSIKFKEAVVDTYLTGIYPNGSTATKERNIFKIVDRIAKMDGYKEGLPSLLSPEREFDTRVGIEIKRVGNNNFLQIKDQTLEKRKKESALDVNTQSVNLISNEFLEQRIKNAAIAEGLTVEQATGLWSGLKNAVAKFSQILGKETEDPRVTQSRLLYSLIARDFIRFVSLSPRFAVKEQELLRDLFPSSGALNSPRQTRSRLILFRNLLKKKIGDFRSTAIYNKDLKEESIEGAKVWANTIRNINTLMPEVPPVETLVDIKNMSPEDTYDYLHSEILGDSSRSLSRDDFEGYRKIVYDRYGPKKGEARIKIFEKKMKEYQTIIKNKRN